MSRNTIRIIILLAVVLLFGLVATQIFWVGKAYDLEQKQFDHEITNSLKNVAQEILMHQGDSAQLFDPVKKVTDNYFQVAINDTLNPYYLESLLKREFKKQEFNVDFEYGIYDCFSDSVVFKKAILIAADSSNLETSAPQIKWDRDGHYFGVYFPNRDRALISEMSFWLASSAFLLMVAVFFAYTISVIMKQKRLSEIKTDFINNMTHEFKTPISTISLSAEVLMSPEIINDPKRLKNYAEIISSENNRLKNQVEKVLQLATLDKAISLNKTEINLTRIIESVVQNFHPVFTEKNVSVTLKALANSTIIADEIHITNVIQNLIDNAIKYSKPESCQIEITTKLEDKWLIIRIKDNGIGITKEHQKHIFEKFYRVPTGDVHNVKGFGLGLNYVKTMVELHRGIILIESELNKGSCFTVKLPVK